MQVVLYVYRLPTERKTDNATKEKRQALTSPANKVTLCRTWLWHLAFGWHLFGRQLQCAIILSRFRLEEFLCSCRSGRAWLLPTSAKAWIKGEKGDEQKW